MFLQLDLGAKAKDLYASWRSSLNCPPQ